MNNSHILKHIDCLCDDNAHEDDYDVPMRQVQSLILLASLETQCTLYSRAINSSYDSGARVRMLETLSMARRHGLAPLVNSAILVFLQSDDVDLQFGAIACATNLPENYQDALKQIVKKFCEDDGYLGRAARCFCEVGEFLKQN